jgi:uncharacterized protein
MLEKLAKSFETGNALLRDECYFWATHTGAELDLLVIRGRRRFGFEFKRTEGPRVTPSVRSALSDLQLDALDIVHAGSESFPLAERVRALALRRIVDDLKPLREQKGAATKSPKASPVAPQR